MNIKVSEMRVSILKDFGRKFEDFRKGAETEVFRFDGAISALKEATQKLEGYKASYKEKLSSGNMEMETHRQIMLAVDQCKGILINLTDSAIAQKLIKNGELQAYSRSFKFLEDAHSEEVTKLEGVLKAIEVGEIRQDSIDSSGGIRPNLSAAEDIASRRAAAKASKRGRKPRIDINTVESTSEEETQVDENSIAVMDSIDG